MHTFHLSHHHQRLEQLRREAATEALIAQMTPRKNWLECISMLWNVPTARVSLPIQKHTPRRSQ